jgi:hypothetical protein
MENSPVRGPSGSFRRTVRDTSMSLEQKLCKTYISTTNCPKERRTPSGHLGRSDGPSATPR